MTEERLRQLLAAMPGTRIAVLGDFCLDAYWMLAPEAGEVSVETGKTTLPVREQRYSPGGAGNVVANLRAIGVGSVACFSIVGDDPFGAMLRARLDALGADTANLLTCTDPQAWQTLTYCKPYIGEDEQPRLDVGNFNALPDPLADELLARLEAILPTVDAVIVNEQVLTGIHTPYLRKQLRALMQRQPGTTFVFDGRHHADCYPEAWLKLNASEARQLCGHACDPQELVLREDAIAAAQALHASNPRPVFVTRGSRGCVVATADGVETIPGIETIGATDPVGAGDSFLSALTATVAAGGTPLEAACMGNVSARIVVAKIRCTGTASPEEILAVGAAPCYIHEPELAEDPRRATYLPGSNLEIIVSRPAGPPPRFAIFDHDGTLSTLREGWEEVMEPMMVRAVLGPVFDHADEALYHKVVRRVRSFIDQTTGVQTLVQMQGLIRLVREFGLVPEDQILDMHGYKQLYNDRLMERVRHRVARLRTGELSPEDFLIKNARIFLETLHAAGVTCFLASGTDEADVRAEAEAMGYAHLFNGGICGAVGDVAKEAKRLVLDRILREIADDPAAVVTFGDGPVEMRETRQRGGYAVGIASDEVRRFDLNPAKRARLIRAGAMVIIPDFSRYQDLLRLLNLAE
jgi:sugar/nucleoside kinase (ribokinase family)/phosphoglycolate phosphatase-like HAD superfamily hydrolase